MSRMKHSENERIERNGASENGRDRTEWSIRKKDRANGAGEKVESELNGASKKHMDRASRSI